GDDCQRVHRSGWRSLLFVADCAGTDPVRDYVRGARRCTLHADAARAKSRIARMTIYRRRRAKNAIVLTLSIGATLFGIGWLALILGTLIWEALSGLSLSVFTEMT